MLERHGIDRSPERLGMFLAQWAHESEFTGVRENLHYSQASRICQTWPRRFPTVASASAAPFAGNPQALANQVYNGRMGNRPGSNDGWTYRGGGWPQLTGRDAYRAYRQRTELDLEGNPNLILQASVSAQVCGLFWTDRGLNAAADQGDMVTITQRINGGQNGAQDRLDRYHRVIPILRDQQAALAAQEELVRPSIPWKQLWVNGRQMDPATARGTPRGRPCPPWQGTSSWLRWGCSAFIPRGASVRTGRTLQTASLRSQLIRQIRYSRSPPRPLPRRAPCPICGPAIRSTHDPSSRF
ncbi:glycoside hydrolase family 19 protein [Deinococcus hopiensis]|uniref:Putative chitinase n=1 Tax=Deinococcus hopiensis KR-140 TaxID=695939 RepID=A0A1W1VCK8_9DEIO|nr:glycoside hydrolase family 19 protein [Deinococcus hopiensis]SMB91197.1 putative chitinase [Deinococcus hopiensis KR-140]